MEDLSLTFFGVSSQFDFDAQKKRLIENLDWFKSMSVEEFTFYKKWEELQNVDIVECGVTKARLWTPTNLDDETLTIKEIQDLRPKVVRVVSDTDRKMWKTLRLYCHSAEYNHCPGRSMKFLLIDEVTDKILGFSCINSDMPGLEGRDEIIGVKKTVWLKKHGEGSAQNSVQCSTIASSQPFGYNFLGGKLMATMLTTSVVRESYKEEYHDVLVGMTTTSLYGQNSMYNGIKWWNGVGISKGKISLQPSPEIYKLWHKWVKENKAEEYLKRMTQDEDVSGPVTSPKLQILGMVFRACGVKASKYVHGYQRGCYYSSFYQNGYDFLRREITEDKLVMKPLFVGGSTAVLEWWKPKAIRRYQKLKQEGRLNTEKLFYNNVKGMTYEQAKAQYFGDVGR